MISQKSVVVTGASTGIGLACVKVLTSAGFRVFAGVRKSEDAERLEAAFGSSVSPLLFDVTDEAAVNDFRRRGCAGSAYILVSAAT